MEAPDRIWLVPICLDGDMQWHSEPAPGATAMYLRATPELLALIEAAKTSAGREGFTFARFQNLLVQRALAFAKSQDHPDAG